ncbi:MAG: GFA family protein [Pseudomonadota bacterium]
MNDERRTGACLCGAVSFTVQGPMRSVSVCHCGQCRAMSGHAWASAVAPRAAISTHGDVTWFRSSAVAERGFCARCGSSLFWRMDGQDFQSVALGALQAPTGLSLEKHIWAAHKGDYYQIADGLPQLDEE